MTRDEFKAHVEETIETCIQEAEKRVGHQLSRCYCFQWMGKKSEPVPQEQVAEIITEYVYVDAEHIYPCFDIGVGDVLDDGQLLIVGSRAGYSPRPWQKNWTGLDGPFVHIMGQKFLDRFGISNPANISSQTTTVKEQRKAIVLTARRILDGSTGIVAGARELTRLRFPSRAETDKDILVFVGIDSESDHLPLGEVRQHWNTDALKTKDDELQCYEARVRDRAFAACQNLIAKYDHAV